MDIEKWTPMIIPLAKSGQIKQIGVSNHNLSEIKRVNEILAKDGLTVSAVQNHYSLLHRCSEKAGIIEYCKQNNMNFFAYMVLEQRALTGKYNRNNPFSDGSSRAISYNSILPELELLTKELKNIGERYKASPAQIAISWAVAKGTLPIIGVTKVNQVKETAEAVKIKLTKEEIMRLENLGDKADVSTFREWEKETI